jgi:4-hydroxy-3-methylbut-2-enyl diphosphate reductase
VSSPQDIPSLDIKDPNKLVYLTQTTLSMDDASRIIDALREAFPKIKDPPSDDICYATTNRQKAVRAIAQLCDLVLVVGSKNSSNSVRLTEIAEAWGAPAYLIDDTSELEEHWFERVERVLITAGASAPEDLVRDLILHLIDQFGGEVEQHDIFHESIEFGLPATLKRFMRSNGIDPNGRRIVRDDAEALDRWLNEQGIAHRTVEVTVGVT